MTHTEYKKALAMATSFDSLLSILEMREAVDLQRSDAATRVMTALFRGTMQD